jgi:hypothetical protein
MFISLFGLLITGLIMAFCADSGPGVPEASKYFLKLHRHQWGGIHSYFAIVFTLLLLIHLILEWKWIVGKTRSLLKKSWMLVPVLLAAVLIIFISWALAPKDYALKRDAERQLKQGWKTESISKEIRPQKRPDPVDRTGEANHQKEPEESAEHDSPQVSISGQDSLLSIQQKTGIRASDIIKLAGLPADISRTERLGRLKRIHGFSIQNIRDAILKLQKGD